MPRNRSFFAKIEALTNMAEHAAAAMHRYNLDVIEAPTDCVREFRQRMARVKQHQLQRLTRMLKAAFDKAKTMTLDELTAKPSPLKLVTFEIEAA